MSQSFYAMTSAVRTADGDSDEIKIGHGGRYQYNISGGFDGGTMTLKYKPAGHSSFVNVQDASGVDITFTATGTATIDVAAGDTIKSTLAGTSSSATITDTLNLIEGYA